jgi:zinc protease
VAYQDLQPYQERDSLAPLLSLAPSPGEIIKEETDTLFHAVRLTLSNGVRVVAKQTSFKEDEIVLSGTSPGGSTLFDAKDWVNLKVFSDVVSLGGLGDHSATDSRRILAGDKKMCLALFLWMIIVKVLRVRSSQIYALFVCCLLHVTSL